MDKQPLPRATIDQAMWMHFDTFRLPVEGLLRSESDAGFYPECINTLVLSCPFHVWYFAGRALRSEFIACVEYWDRWMAFDLGQFHKCVWNNLNRWKITLLIRFIDWFNFSLLLSLLYRKLGNLVSDLIETRIYYIYWNFTQYERVLQKTPLFFFFFFIIPML